ncbi:helix-turn-helix transcriptional regulator [Streptomyces sp. NPDC004629]|uniref:helix-turn-helix transcriptional regulator n=1 Tax=Streptomyces sp. NPDC004629 TaxID=3364705 RepID=UPI0036B12BB5
MRLEYVILGLLGLRNFSGYDMRKWMDGNGQYLGYGAQLPQIYRTLAKMADKGWVEFEVDARDGKPDAKVYRLTAAGRQEFIAWARSPYVPSTRPMDPDFMVRFVFGAALGRDVAIDLLRTELDYRRKQAAHENWIDFAQASLDPIPEVDPAWAREVHWTAHERGYASTAAYIAWLELTLARFEIAQGLPPTRDPR